MTDNGSELPNGVVIEARWMRDPIPRRWPKETGPVEETEVLVKVEGVWYPAGVETYAFDTDEELRTHYPNHRIVSWPIGIEKDLRVETPCVSPEIADRIVLGDQRIWQWKTLSAELDRDFNNER